MRPWNPNTKSTGRPGELILRQTVPVGAHCVSANWATEAGEMQLCSSTKTDNDKQENNVRKTDTVNSINDKNDNNYVICFAECILDCRLHVKRAYNNWTKIKEKTAYIYTVLLLYKHTKNSKLWFTTQYTIHDLDMQFLTGRFSHVIMVHILRSAVSS